MNAATHIFVDRIANISVTGSLVRLEFGTISLPRAEGEKPQLVGGHTLVMPLDGFVASMGMLDALMKQLVKDGAVKMQPQQADVP